MSAELWDALVVGAGPAGSVSAALLARRGWRVLLVEKSDWPRDKACGGCVVEPFTGEGISWAIRGAVEAARLLPRHAADWHDGLIAAWQQRYETAVRSRQRWCRRLRALLQRPLLAAGCLAAARCWPAAPARLARRICA